MGIFTDQIGFEPNEKKIIVTTEPGSYKLVNEDNGECVLVKEAVKKLEAVDPLSEEETYSENNFELNTLYQINNNNQHNKKRR